MSHIPNELLSFFFLPVTFFFLAKKDMSINYSENFSEFSIVKFLNYITLWQKPTFYPEFDVWKMWILKKMRLWNCELFEKLDFEIVNFVKNEIFENVNFVKNEIFENVNFVENEILKLWIFWKVRIQNVNFCVNCRFLPQREILFTSLKINWILR